MPRNNNKANIVKSKKRVSHKKILITPEEKLKKRINKEFLKKKMIGDIPINDEEFDILVGYFKKKYNYMVYTGKHTIIDPIMCVALTQIGIRYYDGAFWPYVKRILGSLNFVGYHQGWIGNSYLETLKRYNKICVNDSDRVATILLHGFVANAFVNKFFNFLYAFYKIDLDRDITRLDSETMNELVAIIRKNDNSGRTYFLVEHTADAVRRNVRGAKSRIRLYLKLIDKAFWGDPLPSSSKSRIMQNFLNWKDTEAEFVRECSMQGGYSRRGKKSYSAPYIKYDGIRNSFKLILPPQMIRFENFTDLCWKIESENLCTSIALNPYAQGITGYKTELIDVKLEKEIIFDNFNIDLFDENNKIRTFRISKDVIRFFDEDGDYIRNDSLTQGSAFSFTKSGFVPYSEAIVVTVDDGILLRTEYNLVNGDIIRIPDGKPLCIGGKLSEGIVKRGIVLGAVAGDYKVCKPVYSEIPNVFIKMFPKRLIGTALRINDNTYHFTTDRGLCNGISEFELQDRSGENGYLIDLRKFGCRKDGEYHISIDVPNDRTLRNWDFVLIQNLKYEFEDAPYIYKSAGTIRIIGNTVFTNKKKDIIKRIENNYFGFDIIPGEPYLYLDYKGLDIGFEIPTFTYQFHSENWLADPHIDVWYTDFEPRVLVSYNAEKIKFLLDDIDNEEDTESEHVETFIKNKSKGLFECDLNRFKSWFGRQSVYRQIYMELPGIMESIPFVRVITQSVLNSGMLKADFYNHKLLGDFDIVGRSEYYVDIEFDGNVIVEKCKLSGRHLEIASDLNTGTYLVTVYESEEDDSGFGDMVFYKIGTVKTQLLNPNDLTGMCISITRIHPAGDNVTYLPLKYEYNVVDFKRHKDEANIYEGKMIVGDKVNTVATFPIVIEFYDLNSLQQAYITFMTDENEAFLYDELKKTIVKEEDKTISKSQVYRRYKQVLYPEEYVFEIKFIERPKNADLEINDDSYNNLRSTNWIKSLMSRSIFDK